ncbi:hypothetical protein TWF694_011551 [Orbilia ellipsospora]|uniref:Cytochrome P450 n=1 Tax=Orbilia ellipsospora TaxID=2528407 RepID=A0AAV9X864_9PEZI
MDDPTCKYRLTMNQFIDDTFTFSAAGSHTTHITATYIMWAIYKDREVLQRLYDEIKTIEAAGLEITVDELRKLPYFEAMITEGLRLYTTIAGSIPRVVPKGGRQLGPHFLPEDTGILSPIYAIHHNTDLFQDPFSFKPERWMDATKEMRDAIVAFGGPGRPCPGQNLAMFELRLILAFLISRCPDLEPAESCTKECMQLTELLLLFPKGGKCEFRKRGYKV